LRAGIANQSKITFYTDTISKRYFDNEINSLSSVENELHCLEKFRNSVANSYCPRILQVYDNGYLMERYSFPLGSSMGILKENIQRVLFTISEEEFIFQLDYILEILKRKNINHRDINPGNLLFFEQDRKIKLIDFYWAQTDGLKVGTPDGLNSVYGIDDSIAFEQIKNQMIPIIQEAKSSIGELKGLISQFGRMYFDGSAAHKGKTYHELDIPYLKTTPFHKDTSGEFFDILDTISQSNPKTLIDIGCAAGYSSFNLLRHFGLEKVLMYEADPYMFRFLNKLKYIFGLNEIGLKKGVKEDEEFEEVDLALCMNVHMWLEKQMGNKVNKVISNLFAKSKETFFQTCGLDGEGMYRVELESKEDVKQYLKGLTSKNVEFIRSTTDHEGGLRYLFKIFSKEILK